jgi:hypothetical protein
VQAPTKYQLVINLKTAKAMGLAISDSFLLLAAPRQLFGYGRSDWSSKLTRGFGSEAPAGFRSRRGDGHDRTHVAP